MNSELSIRNNQNILKEKKCVYIWPPKKKTIRQNLIVTFFLVSLFDLRQTFFAIFRMFFILFLYLFFWTKIWIYFLPKREIVYIKITPLCHGL